MDRLQTYASNLSTTGVCFQSYLSWDNLNCIAFRQISAIIWNHENDPQETRTEEEEEENKKKENEDSAASEGDTKSVRERLDPVIEGATYR
jgi:hypothetical protein